MRATRTRMFTTLHASPRRFAGAPASSGPPCDPLRKRTTQKICRFFAMHVATPTTGRIRP